MDIFAEQLTTDLIVDQQQPHSCTTNYGMVLTLILTGPLLVAEIRHGFRGMGWLHGRFRGRRNRGASVWPFFEMVPLKEQSPTNCLSSRFSLLSVNCQQ